MRVLAMDGVRLFLSVFGVIFVAELPDKTALAALFLATRLDARAVFLGSAAALTVQSLVAVAAGSLLSLLPARPVHLFAGGLFLVSAVLMWRRGGDDDDEGAAGRAPPSFARAAWTVFVVVFAAEWGDLTQLATGALAARYKAPVLVFCASTAALWAVTGLVVFVGNRARGLANPEVTKKVAAVVFAGVGVALAAGWI